MQTIKASNQYARVANEAYENILHMSMSFEEAWNTAAEKIIKSKASREKQCPLHAFLGFCESGDLKGVKGTQQSNNINYQYAKFAIEEWRINKKLSATEMWKRVYANFKMAKNHQGQLDVVQGLISYFR